jgi:hypothetical protein
MQPVSFNNSAVPLKDFPSVRYMNTSRSKSIAFFISRPRVNAQALLPCLAILQALPTATAQEKSYFFMNFALTLLEVFIQV